MESYIQLLKYLPVVSIGYLRLARCCSFSTKVHYTLQLGSLFLKGSVPSMLS